ncbi:WD40 repeat-like protein [Ceratobasidium sp. AG-I]|nr:WD40 repeat-like protein [Ceratobasidium sp. AG-I]
MSVNFSPDSRCLASGSRDNTVQVWNTKTGAALFEPLRGHSDDVNSVVFSPDGRFIISGSDDMTVRIWDAYTGASVAEPLAGHSGWISTIACSPDGRRIATGSQDKAVQIWDVGIAIEDPNTLIAALCSAPSMLSLSTGFLVRYDNKSGWVTTSDGALLLWLPKDRRRRGDSIIQISSDPTVPQHLLLEFSKFVHGDSWISVSRD